MPSSLRIALILETSGGGSGRHVLDLARGLRDRGHDVTVFWSEIRAQKDFVAALEAEPGLTRVKVSMQRAVGLADATSLRALMLAIRGQRPFDILHGHSSKAGALVRLLPRSIPGARIYTPHAFRTMDPELGRPQRAIYGRIERVLADRAARIIVVSRAEQDHAEMLGISRARLALVVNGVALPEDADRHAARMQMALPEEAFAVGFIGRLEAQKDPLRFVAAVALAAREVPELRGLVIGDGPLRAAAERLAPPGSVRFLGWQDGPRLIPGLDLFCMTSRYEAMPYTLLEALHADVPIVTTDIGGAGEAVRDGETGCILPLESSPAEIAAALVALARDQDRRAAFAAATGRLARQRTIEAMVSQTLAVYRDARAAETPVLETAGATPCERPGA